MFTASLNLEALKQVTQGPDRICAVEGCDKPVAPAGQADAQYCAEHARERRERPRRARKARR
jgi:hypothetical protein